MSIIDGAILKSGADIISGWDWYTEKCNILRNTPAGSVIVDVGCKEGSWTKDALAYLPAGTMRIGIDPSNYPPHDYLTHYHCCAIDDVESTNKTFFIFDEPGCNSLLPKSRHLVSRAQINSVSVPVRNLETILLQHVPAGTTIHYVKCDCQGKDVDVAKSLRSFLKHTNYIQIESSFSRERPFYDGQPCYEDDVATMKNLGFKPLFYIIYPESPLPEGEILFGRE